MSIRSSPTFCNFCRPRCLDLSFSDALPAREAEERKKIVFVSLGGWGGVGRGWGSAGDGFGSDMGALQPGDDATIALPVPPRRRFHRRRRLKGLRDSRESRLTRAHYVTPRVLHVSRWDASFHYVRRQIGDSAWGAGVPVGLPQKPLSSSSSWWVFCWGFFFSLEGERESKKQHGQILKRTDLSHCPPHPDF